MKFKKILMLILFTMILGGILPAFGKVVWAEYGNVNLTVDESKSIVTSTGVMPDESGKGAILNLNLESIEELSGLKLTVDDQGRLIIKRVTDDGEISQVYKVEYQTSYILNRKKQRCYALSYFI